MSLGKALVIDDEKNIRLTLSKCLKFADVEVNEAINGEEGLKILESGKFDIIFLDLKMPGMGGIETLKRIKEMDPQVPVVIITAHGTVDVAVDAMKMGAADFMQKPFTPQEIQDLTKEIFSRQSLKKETLESSDSYIQFAKQQIIRKDYEGALENLKKSIGIDPLRAEPQNIIGAILEIQGNLQEAEKYYKTAVALNPSYDQAQKNLARVRAVIKAR
jgi:DNA-binding NtrC family response regulator